MLSNLSHFLSLVGCEGFQIASNWRNPVSHYETSACSQACNQSKNFRIHGTIVRLKPKFKSSKILVMTIGQVSRQSGLAASTIRFYEKAGVLPKPIRVGGRRNYDPSILERLAVLGRAKACGFSLAEARQLFYGFRHDSPPSERWRTLARRKLAELDDMLRKIVATKELLERSCECKDFTECGRRILSTKHTAEHKHD